MPQSIPRINPFRWPAALLALAFTLLNFTACNMSTLPRNMNLKAFDPHRADFTCKHEADVNPPTTAEAEALFQRGMVVTSYELLPDKRGYTKAAELWTQAATLGHWKAAMNLAGLYESGLGMPQDSEQAVLIVEGLMKQGVPAAFDKMGTYHQRGIGVKGDTSRAYAFWQLAADMGSSAAQAYLGPKLKGTYDNPEQGFWGNREVALKMLECGFAQGNGDAAYELALTTGNREKNTEKEYLRALQIYHEGVKLGCKNCARDLSVSFGLARPLTGNLIDKTRDKRYSTLYEALELNPDLRFPNLDKVLPLPPAPLPFWDGKRETLIDAAKAVIVKQPTPATPGANRTGRAHIPQGFVLTGNITLPPGENAYDNQGRPWSLKAKQYAHFTGYWLPRIDVVRGDWQVDWNAAQVPLHFKRGEPLPNLAEQIPPGYGAVSWHYEGSPVRLASSTHPDVAQGIARYLLEPDVPTRCSGTAPCPQTGIWSARLKKEHEHYAVFHDRWQQAYIEQGQPFPVPSTLHEPGGITVAARDIRWHWCGDPNQVDASGHVHVTLSKLLGASGAVRNG
ncbi:tetratricopeptide repeat protein [Variovorax sp. IB41]|uniref:tetratricopeptide repeat protein n=1 Tax=Variovorax sp. IB41 TaxID=2779370 RepID=UPI0018E8BDC5|nr:tetratricopeptide repeat protein [Variovorax sp. IB41]MBJ2158487.1 sel1 repeat family protein [Variovorax sp. IB41]